MDTRVEENIGNVNMVEVGKGEFDMPGIDARQPEESGEVRKKNSRGLELDMGKEKLDDVGVDCEYEG